MGRNSVANLQKIMLYNPNVDLVNDNVFAKFGYILSIHSQDGGYGSVGWDGVWWGGMGWGG